MAGGAARSSGAPAPLICGKRGAGRRPILVSTAAKAPECRVEMGELGSLAGALSLRGLAAVKRAVGRRIGVRRIAVVQPGPDRPCRVMIGELHVGTGERACCERLAAELRASPAKARLVVKLELEGAVNSSVRTEDGVGGTPWLT